LGVSFESAKLQAWLEKLRRVFILESIKEPEGNVIREAPLPVWANSSNGRSTSPFLSQHENRFENKARSDRAFKTASGSRAEIHDQNSNDTEKGNSLTVNVTTRLQ
jgi:hypothetical protein